MKFINKKYSTKMIITLVTVLILGLGGINMIRDKEVSTNNSIEQITKASLLNISELKDGSAIVSSVGKVEALDQVELRSEVFKSVSKVNVKIGDAVQAGDILVQLENADLLARLSQAEAGTTAEKSRLKESEQILTNTYGGVVNTVVDALAKSEDGVVSKTTGLFYGSETSTYWPRFSCNSQTRIDSSHLRLEAGKSIDNWQKDLENIGQNPTNDELDTLLDNSQTNLRVITSFFNLVQASLNEDCAIENAEFDDDRITIGLVRNELTRSVSAIDSLKQAIASQKIVITEGGAGGTQLARIDAAIANTASVQAQLTKTIIRSPISGVVASIPVRVGELVRSGDLLANIVNDSGLQIKTSVNTRDSKLIKVGDKVIIEGTTSGVITAIAPSVSPITNKIEVEIGILDNSDLIVGEFVNLDISVKKEIKKSDEVLIPLESIKSTVDGAFIYIVNEDNIIEKKQVELGSVVGENIEVKSGLNGIATIVESVRGVDLGELVEIK